MRRVLAVTFVLALASASLCLAQAPPQMSKPGPEHKRIGYFLGKWTGEAEMKESPFGPAGKFTFTDHNEWFPGGFFMVVHSEGKGPMGEMKALEVIGYNADEKLYTFNAFESTGMSEYSKGTVKGDTWNWTSESKVRGKKVNSRFTIKEVSPISYTFKWEISTDGGPWSTITEGKSTKVEGKSTKAK